MECVIPREISKSHASSLLSRHLKFLQHVYSTWSKNFEPILFLSKFAWFLLKLRHRNYQRGLLKSWNVTKVILFVYSMVREQTWRLGLTSASSVTCILIYGEVDAVTLSSADFSFLLLGFLNCYTKPHRRILGMGERLTPQEWKRRRMAGWKEYPTQTPLLE